MSDQEKLHFKIGLSGTYWDKTPEYSILINDEKKLSGKIESSSGEIVFLEFDHEFVEGEQKLKIRLENKTDSDTLENSDKTGILKDMLLDIKSIEIDDIDLGSLLWTKSEFVADDPSRPVLANCVNLGWNGTYVLPFSTPYYIWLLENI